MKPTTAPTPLRLFVLGASVMSGFGLTDSHNVEAELTSIAAKDGVNVEIDNQSQPGRRVSEGVEVIRQGLAQKPQPNRLLITLGIGEIFFGLTTEDLRADLDRLLSAAAVTLPPSSIYLVRNELPQHPLLRAVAPETRTGWPQVFDHVAAHSHVVLLPFFLRFVTGRADMNQPDGIHPNAIGARVVARTLWHDMRVGDNSLPASGGPAASDASFKESERRANDREQTYPASRRL